MSQNITSRSNKTNTKGGGTESKSTGGIPVVNALQGLFEALVVLSKNSYEGFF